MDAVSSHSCHLLQQLHEQRIQGLLCDCMLVVKGVCFKAHKNVLAAFSQYFRTLFQNSSGQKNDIFHLDIKNVGGIGQILDYMYTSHLDLNQDNIQTLLDIAQCLQVQKVLNMCHSFLKPSPAVEQPASMPCNAAFSLPDTLAADTNCEGYGTNLLQACSSVAQPCKVLEDHHLHGPEPVALPVSAGDKNKQKQDSMDPGCTGLPFKQPNCYYKLRNFYSKQFYKQTTCPTNKELPEPSFAFSAPAEQNAVENASCTVNPSECILEAPDHLPPNFLDQPLSECPEYQDSEGPAFQPANEMRLKKAIHLKKLNFLRSQKSSEQPPGQNMVDGDVTREMELEKGSRMEQANIGSVEGKEVEDLVHSECLEQSAELEPSQEPSEPDSQIFIAERQYPCALCGKAFKHPSNLELHIRSHTGEKPFECNICGKCFSQAGNLQTHLRRHSGEKPYICEICGKRFAASGDVQRHIIIHTGEKPHLCDICGRGFSNFSNLKEHKKNHTVEKVFTCDECGKSFNLPRKLVKHRIRHTGERPYSCSACGKCFAGSGDLRRHIRTHTGEKPYTCETCNKCFSRSAVLRRHIKIHCKSDNDNEGASALDEFTQAVEISDLEKSQNSDSFTQEISVTLLPVSVKFPIHSTGNSGTEFDGPGVTFRKVRPTVQQDDGTNEPKLGLDPIKPCKSQQRPNRPHSCKEVDAPLDEEPLQSDGIPLVRSSVATLGSNCSGELSGRVSSSEYRNNDGPFFSSVTLWGLAMKTLQNESELGQ
ncbi:zinc finger and BTB domain-containing protein 49 [Tiliqua scincoides]|uniref:zinc finger and BTB domain-containing protein 49 n=1 Tax=Tiliqua scincoides TaxID=71010 RepID=UPI003461F41E